MDLLRAFSNAFATPPFDLPIPGPDPGQSRKPESDPSREDATADSDTESSGDEMPPLIPKPRPDPILPGSRVPESSMEPHRRLRALWEAHQPKAHHPELYALTAELGPLPLAGRTVRVPVINNWEVYAYLADLYADMITSPHFFQEYPEWVEHVLVARAEITRLCQISGAGAVTTGKTLDNMPGVIKALWLNRKKLMRIDADWMIGTEANIMQFTSASKTLKRIPAWKSTFAAHLAMFCWFYKPPMANASHLYSTLFLLAETIKSASDIGSFGKAMVDEFGAEAYIRRFARDLEDPNIVDEPLAVCVQVMAAYIHPPSLVDLRPLMSKSLMAAMKKQAEKGSNDGHEWRIWHHAATILQWCASEGPASMSTGPMIRENIVSVLARGVTLCASTPRSEIQMCIGLLQIFVTAAVTCKRFRRADMKELHHTMHRDARKDWYPALQALRDMPPVSVFQRGRYTELLEAWTKFGIELRLDENESRERYEKAGGGTQKADSSVCSWKQWKHSTVTKNANHGASFPLQLIPARR
ncbi:hypothetical protein OF83DRAFT_1080852 [Amylostereum chailletii]|nr:hypothetical protein OF83DRAFT_1080852 [Amylostereum chailletii]